jgi:YfiH family protein
VRCMKKPRTVSHNPIVGIPVSPQGTEGAIRCLFSTIRGPAGGQVLDFDHRKGDNPVVLASYEAAADWFGVGASSIFVMRQVHGGDIAVLRQVPDQALMRGALAVDGAVTDCPGLVLTVLTADCLPILMADRKRQVIAAVHAGWRSTVAGIAGKAVGLLADAFGSDPADIRIALGPAIGRCCFEVGPEVVQAIHSAFAFADDYIETRAGGKGMVDLAGLNRRALMEAGVPADGIRSADLCTYCRDDLFYSYRRQGEGTGRMMAGIMIEE